MEYPSITLRTNLASRLEQTCKPGKIYLSNATLGLDRDEILSEEVGTVEAKGFPYTIQTYRVLQNDVQ